MHHIRADAPYTSHEDPQGTTSVRLDHPEQHGVGCWTGSVCHGKSLCLVHLTKHYLGPPLRPDSSRMHSHCRRSSASKTVLPLPCRNPCRLFWCPYFCCRAAHWCRRNRTHLTLAAAPCCLASALQMERRMGRIADPLRLAVARQILQRGLSTNPDSGCLAQVGEQACSQQQQQHEGTRLACTARDQRCEVTCITSGQR